MFNKSTIFESKVCKNRFPIFFWHWQIFSTFIFLTEEGTTLSSMEKLYSVIKSFFEKIENVWENSFVKALYIVSYTVYFDQCMYSVS